MTLEQSRREYRYGKLTRKSLHEDPIAQFEVWMEQAVEAGIQDPTAMSLATVADSGRPSQRIVLLKNLNQKGFVFYTNFSSRKAVEMANNPAVSLLFPWLQLDRQVVVGGTVEKLSASESLGYFLKRPRESQIAAWASKQSRRLTSRQILEVQFLKMKEKFSQGDVPLPDFWGGYRVVPTEVEFWQGGENRLHDRFQYQRQDDCWQISRLSP